MTKIRGTDRPVMSIPIPYVGVVRVEQVLPIIDSKPFQDLDRRKQLGFMGMIFRGAGYSRYVHTLVAYYLTCRRMERFVRWKQCTEQDRIDVEVAVLLHDIGHGPGSHLTDPLVSEDHEERGLRIAESLREEIEACGARFEVVMAILARTHPLSCIIYDTPLGTDKLAYLWIDSEMTGLGGMPPRAHFLDSVHYKVVDGQGMLLVDPKVGNQVKILINHYIKMYADGYYKKASSVYERGFQWVIARLLGLDGSDPQMTVDQLVSLSDDGLIEALLTARDSVVRRATERLIARQHPRSAIVLVAGRADGFFAPDGKPMVCRRVSMEYFSNRAIAKPAFLARVEKRLSAALGLAEGDLLITPPLLLRRFLPPTVRMMTDAGPMHIEHYWPEQYRAWVAEAPSYLKFHICVIPEKRASIAQQADRVLSLFEEAVRNVLNEQA